MEGTANGAPRVGQRGGPDYHNTHIHTLMCMQTHKHRDPVPLCSPGDALDLTGPRLPAVHAWNGP